VPQPLRHRALPVCRIGQTRNTHKILVEIPLDKTRQTGYLKLGKVKWETKKRANGFRFLTNRRFLGAIAKLQEATITLVMPVLPSACMHAQCVCAYDANRSRLDGFLRNLIFGDSSNIYRKTSVLLKSHKKNGTLHDDPSTFMILFRWTLLRMWKSKKQPDTIKHAVLLPQHVSGTKHAHHQHNL
jgi:hypothetical protein